MVRIQMGVQISYKEVWNLYLLFEMKGNSVAEFTRIRVALSSKFQKSVRFAQWFTERRKPQKRDFCYGNSIMGNLSERKGRQGMKRVMVDFLNAYRICGVRKLCFRPDSRDFN